MKTDLCLLADELRCGSHGDERRWTFHGPKSGKEERSMSQEEKSNSHSVNRKNQESFINGKGLLGKVWNCRHQFQMIVRGLSGRAVFIVFPAINCTSCLELLRKCCL